MTLFSINGTGLRLLSAKKTSDPKIFRAVVWFCILFLPLIPLKALEIRITSAKRQKLKFEVLKRVSLAESGAAIFKTYFFSWGFIPLVLLAPLILAIAEVQVYLGIPQDYHFVLMTVSLVWLVVFVWKLMDWHQDGWHK